MLSAPTAVSQSVVGEGYFVVVLWRGWDRVRRVQNILEPQEIRGSKTLREDQLVTFKE